ESELERVLVNALGSTAQLQSAFKNMGGKLFLLVFPQSTPILPMLRLAVEVLDRLQTSHPDGKTRFLIHHGVVFTQQEYGKTMFVGSATRSAQAILSRMPRTVCRAVTPAFMDLSKRWGVVDMQFNPLEGGAVSDRLQSFQFISESPLDIKSAEYILLTPSQLTFITSRLAEYIGPFAATLVEEATNQVNSTTELIRALGREIDNRRERSRFESDVELFLRG
ncbi:MAG TPA: hypothetical protein VFM46_06305, partial [Pseudomonadales bacterium]|nr:hypothetical protein [Pseudomonadales bacterium]